MTMTPSKVGLDLIKGYEKCRLRAYMPTAHDVPTIGWGTTGKDIHMGMVWTQKQCDDRFAAEMAVYAKSVDTLVKGVPTNQNQFDAFVSFSYNEGAQRLHDSLILSYHKAGHYALAASCFMHYTTQAHIVLAGLVKRRHAELSLYLKPL